MVPNSPFAGVSAMILLDFLNGNECRAVMDRALKMVYYDDAKVERDIFAQLSLALRHFRGVGMPRDEGATRKILDQIHRQSRAFAAICYGFMRSKGIGVAEDQGEG